MSPIKIALLSAGLLAVTSSLTMASEVRYAGSPKFGQSYVQEQHVGAGKSPHDARAQLMEAPRDTRKGGIGARGL